MKVNLNILHFLEHAANAYGERTAVLDPYAPVEDPLRQMSYREFLCNTRRQARAFTKLGLKPGAKIAIVSDNNARFFITFFSVSGFGRILVPINYRLKKSEIEYIVRHSDAELILVDEKSYAETKDLGIPVIVLGPSTDKLLFCDEEIPLSPTDDEDFPASINYTSGTTALPKGVVLTHRNLYLAGLTFAMHLAPRDGEVYLHTLPMFHCNGWGMPYILSAQGAMHVIHQNCTGSTMLAACLEYGVTQVNGAPTVMQRLIEAKKNEGAAFRGRHRLRVLVAGAAPPVKMIEEVETILNAEFFQLYGLTETAPLLTACKPRYEWDHCTPYERATLLARAGVASLGMEIKIADDGEVLARSNGVLQRYYKDEEATKMAMLNDWFHTGDGGILDEDGYLVLTDRKKDMIISGGENVASLEVENVLYLHRDVSEACVIGVHDEEWGEMVTALVVPKEGATIMPSEIIDHCRAHLAHFKCPKRVEFVASLPRTATGKLQKFKLRAQLSSG